MVSVFVQTDDKSRIKDVGSNVFLGDAPDGWTKVDEGEGDKYAHAQNQYLPDRRTEDGVCRYKLKEGKVVERSEAEIAEDVPTPTYVSTVEQQITDLQLAMAELYEEVL